MLSSLLVILICLSLAYLLSELLKQIGLPRLVGQVVAGLFLSISTISSFLFSPESKQVLSFLADLGIILLFYYVGLETNFRAFTKNIKRSVWISLFNTSLPFVIGFLITYFTFKFDLIVSIIISVALSVSAQSASIDLLEELKMLKTKIGNLIIAAGAIDDIIELILVTLALSLLHVSITHKSMANFVFDTSLFLIIIILAKILLIPKTLKFFDREHSSTARFTGSLLIVLLIASLSEMLGIGMLIGAMIAGIIIRQTIYKEVSIPNWEEHDIARSVHIIAFGFLIPLFFVWVGLNTDLTAVYTHFWFILLLVVIATLGTVGGTAIALLLSGSTLKEGLIIGWGLNPKGDAELVIASIALQAAIISKDIFTSLVLMSLATTIISPVIFEKLVLKYRKLIR